VHSPSKWGRGKEVEVEGGEGGRGKGRRLKGVKEKDGSKTSRGDYRTFRGCIGSMMDSKKK
jgi:hypothetical protein